MIAALLFCIEVTYNLINRVGRLVNFPLNRNFLSNLREPVLAVDSDVDEMLRPNRYLLTCIGLWPLAPSSSRLARIASSLCLVFTMLVSTLMLVVHTATVYVHWGDLDMLGDNESLLAAYLSFLIKMSFMAIRQRDFRVVYEHVREFWRVARTQEERNAIVRICHGARFCTITFFCLATLDCVLFVTSALLITLRNYVTSNGSDYFRRLPLNLWYGVDTQVSPNYELLMAQQAIILFNSVVAAVGTDCTTVAVVVHVAAQFRIVGLRLRDIGREVSRESLDRAGGLSSKLRACVRHHQEVLRVFQLVDDLLGPVILCDVLIKAMQICLCCYCIVQPNSSLASMTKFAILLVICWLQIGLWCWSGEVVVSESSSIAHVIYHEVPWRVLPRAAQRDLGFVLNRSQRWSTLTAMQLQVMNLQKLTEVFKTSVSYLSVLRKFTNDAD